MERQAGKKAKTNAETRHREDNKTAERLLTTEYLNLNSFFILVCGGPLIFRGTDNWTDSSGCSLTV
jgi:hypothetical protein